MTFEAQNQSRIQELEQELKQIREDAALVVHALNCAIQLTDALIAYMPDGSPMHPGVGAAKGALDNAMRAINSTLRSQVA